MAIDLSAIQNLASFERVKALASDYKSRRQKRQSEDGKDYVTISIFLSEVELVFQPSNIEWWELVSLLPEFEEFFYEKERNRAISVGRRISSRPDSAEILEAGFSQTAISKLMAEDDDVVDSIMNLQRSEPNEHKPSNLSCNELREKIAAIRYQKEEEKPEPEEEDKSEEKPKEVELPIELVVHLRSFYQQISTLWNVIEPFVKRTETFSDDARRDSMLLLHEYLVAYDSWALWIHEKCAARFQEFKAFADLAEQDLTRTRTVELEKLIERFQDQRS